MIAEIVHAFAATLALLAEGLGALVIAVAIVRAIWRYAVDLITRSNPFPRERIRLGVARSLVLALEFLLAADILRTAVDPSPEELARLAAIAAIRTVLNFFLQREIAHEEQRTTQRQEDGRPEEGAVA